MKNGRGPGIAFALIAVLSSIGLAYTQTCSYSGQVIDSRVGGPISGVRIYGCALDTLGRCSAGLLDTTDSGGHWSVSQKCVMPSRGITLRIWASKSCLSFSPLNYTKTITSAGTISRLDFVGTFNSYTISGNVGAAGVTMSGLPIITVSDASGNYSTTVPCGWSGTVTPTRAGYTFAPSVMTYTNLLANAVQNYSPQPVPKSQY